MDVSPALGPLRAVKTHSGCPGFFWMPFAPALLADLACGCSCGVLISAISGAFSLTEVQTVHKLHNWGCFSHISRSASVLLVGNSLQNSLLLVRKAGAGGNMGLHATQSVG